MAKENFNEQLGECSENYEIPNVENMYGTVEFCKKDGKYYITLGCVGSGGEQEISEELFEMLKSELGQLDPSS